MEAVQQAKETTATDLGWLLDESDDALVTLIAGETRLLVHRAVLTDRSPVFTAMFQHQMLEASSGSVTIPDVEGPVLRQLVAYLYRLQAPQLPAMAPQLLAAADKYGLSGLKDACEQQVAAQLTMETAVAAAVLAIRHNCEGLIEAAIDFIKSHLVEVMATQGWADAVRMQPEDVVEMGRLLSETRRPAAVDIMTSSSSTSQPHSGRRQTPASAAPPTATAYHGSPPDEYADCLVRRPAAVDRGASPSPAPQPLSDHSFRCQTPASATASAVPHRETPASAAVCHLRQLSAKEKGERLIKAVKEGAVGQLQALLAAGAAVAARDRANRRTALHWAARKGREEAARRLLAAGAAVDARDSGLATPLHCAASNGQAAVVRLLLAAGAYHGARNVNGWTPLHCAAANGHTKAAAALLQGGAVRAATDSEGRTPLDYARICNKQQVAQLLMQRRKRPTSGTGLQATAQKL